MAYIPLARARPGMLPKSDIKTYDGRILIKAGTELTANHIDLMQSAAIASIDVTGDNNPASCADSSESAESLTVEQLAALSRLFAYNNLNEASIQQLYAMCAEQITAKRGHGS
jgi:hypothetical protein